MTKLQHFYTARLLHGQPSTFFNNKATMEQTSRNTTTKLLHDQSSTFLTTKYYMTKLQHFLTKLLHDQTSTFLNNKTTTKPTCCIS